MAKLFGIDIAKEVSSAISGAGGVLPAKLIKVTPSERTAASPTAAPEPKKRSISCHGFVDSYSEGQRDDTRIQVGDWKVSLLGSTIAGGKVIPETGDRIEIDGMDLEVIDVDTDPARAVYDCQSRV